MATSILYNLPESKGTGKSFEEIMGFFVPAYIIVAVIFVIFKLNFEPTVTILAGFVAGIILKAIDFPTFYNRFFKFYRDIYDIARTDKETYKFYINMTKDPKYSVEIYRNFGYSDCYIHLGPSFLVIGIVYLLAFYKVINIPINYGMITSIGLMAIGIIAIYASYQYRKKVYRIMRSELNNYIQISKKEGEIGSYYEPTVRYAENEKKYEINMEEKIVALLESNPNLVFNKSVQEILKEKKMNLDKLKKSRLEMQLMLYQNIDQMIRKTEKNLSNIQFPAQLKSLNDKDSKVKRYIIEIKKSLTAITQQIEKNIFSSDDIPSIYKKLDGYKNMTDDLNGYIDFECYLNKINDRISKIKTQVTNGKKRKLADMETEVIHISDWYLNYMDEDKNFPPSYMISEKQEILTKIEKELAKEFKNYILYGLRHSSSPQ